MASMSDRTVKRVAVVGAGTQGAQIAFRCAAEGYDVALVDISAPVLELAKERIAQWADGWRQSSRLSAAGAEAVRGRIRYHNAIAPGVCDADLVIEAVPEKLDLKRQVWAQIDALAPAPALLTTNSSSIRSSLLAEGIGRKQLTFSINFSMPAEDDLVEVMWNAYTDAATRQAARTFASSLQMTVLVTGREIQGFSFNRVWRAIKKECLRLYAGGYCDPTELDRHFCLEFGCRIGPFALMDKVGLDVVRDIELSYYRESGDESDRPPQALLDLIAQGHLGVKTGRGFYTYPGTDGQ